MRNNTKIKHLVHLHRLLMQISTLPSINVSTNQGCRFFRDHVHGLHLLYSSSSFTYSHCCCHAAVQRCYEMCCERDAASEGLDWPAGKPVDISRGKEASRGARTKRSPAQKRLGPKQSRRGWFEWCKESRTQQERNKSSNPHTQNNPCTGALTLVSIKSRGHKWYLVK